ncbi:MAG: cation transporter [Rickettsiales bacterium]|nr:cation transporter [Rickettsiales bacterium]
MIRIIGFAIILAAFWMVNSGYFKPLLLELGLASVLVVVWLIWRMERVDGRKLPIIMATVRLPFYLMWLSREIIKSNIDVVRCILSPKRISPNVFKVKASQQTDVGRVMYANGITMTPGTVTLDIDGDEFTIHALTREGAEGVKEGTMDAKVRKLEG